MPEKLTVHLGRISKTRTPIELFPDPHEVFVDYSKWLAERVMPVISFDLALAGGKGRGVFLYYQDYSVKFLEWKTDGERITEINKQWIERMCPFDEKPDWMELHKSVGRYLALDRVELTVEPPESQEDWKEHYSEAFEAAGAKRWAERPRIGSHYPYYVQSHDMTDDLLIVGELPANFLNLPPMYLYLFENNGKFQQELQMT